MPYLTLTAAMLLTSLLGSLHAFSIFIEPLEDALTADRGAVSAIYSVALVSLTIAVLFGHRVYNITSPWLFCVSVCVIAALGLMSAAGTPSLLRLWLGFGLVFGAANGLGYGFALQLVAQALPARKGFAMGAVTATYAVGAMMSAAIFAALVKQGGVGHALTRLSEALVIAALVVGAALWFANAQFRAEPKSKHNLNVGALGRLQTMLWAGYGLACAAGLMAIGHAAGIMGAAGGTAQDIVLGATLIGFGNALGGFVAGFIADRCSPRWLLVILALISAAALVMLAYAIGPALALASLATIGFAYGATIAIYPYAVSHYCGVLQAPRIYGRVFTAWGIAGLLSPSLAGIVFDSVGGYKPALFAAATAAIGSAIVAGRLPRDGAVPDPTDRAG